jgi:hypothetical protein
VNELTNALTGLDAQQLLALRAKIDATIGSTFDGVKLLWIAYAIFVLLPVSLSIVYYVRRLGTRRALLLQTILSMRLDDPYMQMRHGQKFLDWSKLKDQNERWQQFEADYFNKDFHADTSPSDYVLPVTLFTLLTALGGIFVLHRFAPGMSPLHIAPEVFPSGWTLGFVGAYLACVLALMDGFRRYDLDPSTYYGTSFRLVFSSLAAGILASAFKTEFAPLVAFAIGLFPLQETWSFITEKASQNLGAKKSEEPLGAELARIQGLEMAPNRQKLLDIGITSIQQLATADPLLIFFRTSLPLRTIIDLIDKAILYLYLGEKVVELRKHGINGAIELMLLAKIANKKPLFSTQVSSKDHPLFQQIEIETVIGSISQVLEQTPEELTVFICNLYYDPLVVFIADLWGRTMPQSAPSNTEQLVDPPNPDRPV